MLVGTEIYVPVVFVWEETGVPKGNPPVWLSHADVGYRTQVATVRDERVTTTPASRPQYKQCLMVSKCRLEFLR